MVNISDNGLGLAVANRASARTRKKILKASIALFNKHGVQHVTTETIATTVGISSSNLTYHFKRRNDLMMALLTVLEENMREALTPPHLDKGVGYRGENLAKILATLWEFRFFFNSLTFLLPKDKRLGEAYFHFQEWAIDMLDKGFDDLIGKGDFRPIEAPNSTRLLAENVWVQWLGWLHMQQIKSQTTKYSKEEALYESAEHFWSLIQPYFLRYDLKRLLTLYRSMFLGAGPRKTATAAKPSK